MSAKTMKNLQKLPAGEYLVTTVSKEEYTKRHEKAEKSKPASFDTLPQTAIDRNFENCGKRMRVNRKPWKVDSEILVNFTKKMGLIPNILILDIQTRDESHKDFPEFWL